MAKKVEAKKADTKKAKSKTSQKKQKKLAKSNHKLYKWTNHLW